jgi:hypothetical protein
VIFGQNLETTREVYFNGTPAPLNSTMVRNDNIIIRIAGNTPYLQGMNKVKVVTAYGEASMDFAVLQKPVIAAFSPAVASSGELLTIKGNFFDAVESVSFLDATTLEEIPATIDFESATELRVIVPEGVKVSYIKVTTPSGFSLSPSTFGFNYIVYTDKLSTDFENWSWGSTIDFSNTAKVKSGAFSWKHTFTGGWSGIQLHHGPDGSAGYPLADLSSLKFSVFGGPGTTGKIVMVMINWKTAVNITLKENEWVDYTIPLSSLGVSGTDNLNLLIFQDNGNSSPAAPYLFYIDDLGFI